jgi:hypothetical protein
MIIRSCRPSSLVIWYRCTPHCLQPHCCIPPCRTLLFSNVIVFHLIIAPSSSPTPSVPHVAANLITTPIFFQSILASTNHCILMCCSFIPISPIIASHYAVSTDVILLFANWTNKVKRVSSGSNRRSRSSASNAWNMGIGIAERGGIVKLFVTQTGDLEMPFLGVHSSGMSTPQLPICPNFFEAIKSIFSGTSSREPRNGDTLHALLFHSDGLYREAPSLPHL